MNIYLAYYNMLDDWNDDKNLLSLGESRLLEKECKKVEQSFPRQCRVIREKLDELSRIEKANVLIPDVPANCFGDLMGELFVPFEDSLDERLRTFGKALGKYIYILDACMDLKKDLDINGLIKNLCIKSTKGNFIEQNKKQLEFFFLKLFTNYLYDKSRVLNYRELEKYYKEGINFIKDFYQKHDMNFSIMYNKTEPFNINLAINIVIMSYKLKFSKILLKILIRKFHVK